MNARACLLAAALALAAVFLLFLWPSVQQSHETVASPPLDPTPAADRVEPDRIPGAPFVSDAADSGREEVRTQDGIGSELTWDDLVAPFDSVTSEPIEHHLLDFMTVGHAGVMTFAPTEPIDESLLVREALGRIRAEGYAPRLFAPEQLKGVGSPRPTPLPPLVEVPIEFIGPVPETAPPVSLSIGSVEYREGQPRDLQAVVAAFEGETTEFFTTLFRQHGFATLRVSHRREGLLDLESPTPMWLFESRVTIEPNMGKQFQIEAPAGATLVGFVDVEDSATVHQVAAFAANGRALPDGTIPETLVEPVGTDPIRLGIDGTATVRWSLRTATLDDSTPRLIAIDARGIASHPRVESDGELSYFAETLTPGPHRLHFSWFDPDRQHQQCERVVELVAGRTSNLGPLDGAPSVTITVTPQLEVVDGVPAEIERRVREELAWLVESRGVDPRLNGQRASTVGQGLETPRSFQVPLGHHQRLTCTLGDFPWSERFDGCFVETSSDLRVSAGQDTEIALPFRLSRSEAIEVELLGVPSRFGRPRNIVAFRDSPSSLGTTIATDFLPPAPAVSSSPGSTIFAGFLGRGPWTLYVHFEARNSDGARVTFVGSCPCDVRADSPNRIAIEVTEGTRAIIRTGSPSEPDIAFAIHSDPAGAVRPSHWPRLSDWTSKFSRGTNGELVLDALLPHTEYLLVADGTTFMTGAPGSIVELER